MNSDIRFIRVYLEILLILLFLLKWQYYFRRKTLDLIISYGFILYDWYHRITSKLFHYTELKPRLGWFTVYLANVFLAKLLTPISPRKSRDRRNPKGWFRVLWDYFLKFFGIVIPSSINTPSINTCSIFKFQIWFYKF